ncbi:MAG TPA: FhaA domain-containing protein [Acidimicrobiia bacterium]
MRLFRELEQRLEGLIDGIAGRVFRGPLHPSEVASGLIRRLDLELDDSMVASNRIEIRMSERDVAGAIPPELAHAIEAFVEEAALERGWRLEGPATVSVVIDPDLPRGKTLVTASKNPGDRMAWGTLHGQSVFPLTVNRSVVGRAGDCDVVIGDERASRHHACLWMEAGRVLVADLGSSNGTWVDGRRVGDSAAPVEPGSVLTFGPVSFRFQPS